MKNKMILSLAAATLLLTGCGSNEAAQPTAAEATATEAPALQAATETAPQSTGSASSGGMLDLTKLSSTMVYSEVFNMLSSPDSYVGRTVKMSGTAACLANPETNQLYYACIIADATGCCAQGLEYVLPAGEVYPEVDANITVTGTFALYYENGYKCFHLVDAQLTT